MTIARLDPKAVDKVSGAAWKTMRPTFDRVNDALLAVSPTTTGELTTIYVKYLGPETNNQSYAVVWIKKSTEIILGLALPEESSSEWFVEAPRGCRYAGLTKYVVLTPYDGVPDVVAKWAKQAYEHLLAK